MELYESAQTKIQKERLEAAVTELVETKVYCYGALEKMKAIVKDDSLSEDERFTKITEIIRSLEKFGIYVKQ